MNVGCVNFKPPHESTVLQDQNIKLEQRLDWLQQAWQGKAKADVKNQQYFHSNKDQAIQEHCAG